MATYVIGDVQGCFSALMKLLKAIDFMPTKDRLIFCGDLVNRGGQSLDVLRWVYAHQKCCDSVLGNHDLSLLSKYYLKKFRTKNTEFKEIFNASDAALLMDWLLHRPLYIEQQDVMVIHAGLYPGWGIKQFKKLATKTRTKMLSDPAVFFKTMYGNTPKQWSEDLAGHLKHRFVINASTRMRFVKKDGALNFSQNGRISAMKNLKPWFSYFADKTLDQHIIFGHWSALGFYQDRNVTCLDTGKVWGGQLTTLQLENQSVFSIT
ncbi:symmetrical bis(5'-nucleosyl)-tetraphosphatase [Marinicella sp. S1101]|uniref:symmetrical bis(5'-nucleosyl)-tetraphosphatase n=1 Tax=Marinicella marina TaxID=2996016 RepID=UPI002260DAB2|nr:symmetrical bis(5'-nucleosyl)-tetraphosphatase [Marinicella marina]MCX7554162.1 symmetrical bis(5'-nucleosyl)-tetraphosphatase [Marinicella marina]MDJ1141145.1 symmetrical bis(5'-nucleosyl)-tetraphosphatase [Marinicella marina]